MSENPQDISEQEAQYGPKPTAKPKISESEVAKMMLPEPKEKPDLFDRIYNGAADIMGNMMFYTVMVFLTIVMVASVVAVYALVGAFYDVWFS